MSRSAFTILAASMLSLACPPAEADARQARPPRSLAPPVEEGPFLVPAPGEASEPTWGVRDGIAVGLWPTPGPRGLFRIYAPYLGQPRPRVINFVAVEPIVGRRRGLSELEPSARDAVAGKAMWSLDTFDPDAAPEPQAPWRPARGRVEGDEGARSLSVFVAVEPFDNGARPVVELTLREDRPHEVAFRVHAAEGSAPMRACILTATMGNYARLRHVWLADRVVDSRRLWGDADEARPDDWGFLPHRAWPLDRLRVVDGEAVVAATTDESDPASVASPPPGWRYRGATATQAWRAAAVPGLLARVNARATYWASDAPIPGGISFENFELEAPFAPGQEFRFLVTPDGPASLGFEPASRPPAP